MRTVDLAIVGAGPAGASAALAARRADPTLSVALIDRQDFPRDKACGDGVAPHVLDLLAGVGVTGVFDDRVPVQRLRLTREGITVDRAMSRPTYVVPRTLLDARLVDAARDAGAVLIRHRVREVTETPDGVLLDDAVRARVVVGADGAHSVLRRALALRPVRTALALRGYAPTPAARSGVQVIAFGTRNSPSYAWSFDRGDGFSNVGYGELLRDHAPRPTRAQLLDRLEQLLPGATDGAEDWRGHQLPLSGWRALRAGRGRILLAGDAAGLINPLTGEGIYYAVATGLLAGGSAATAVRAGTPSQAGTAYSHDAERLLRWNLRHTAVASWLSARGRTLDAGLRASARHQRVFDDVVELGLAKGRITPTLAAGLAAGVVNGAVTDVVRRPGRLRARQTPAAPSHEPQPVQPVQPAWPNQPPQSARAAQPAHPGEPPQPGEITCGS